MKLKWVYAENVPVGQDVYHCNHQHGIFAFDASGRPIILTDEKTGQRLYAFADISYPGTVEHCISNYEITYDAAVAANEGYFLEVTDGNADSIFRYEEGGIDAYLVIERAKRITFDNLPVGVQLQVLRHKNRVWRIMHTPDGQVQQWKENR